MEEILICKTSLLLLGTFQSINGLVLLFWNGLSLLQRHSLPVEHEVKKAKKHNSLFLVQKKDCFACRYLKLFKTMLEPGFVQ